MKQISKTGFRQFRVNTTIYERGGTTIFNLDLDFNPVIDALSDREKAYEDYLIIHWQGAPSGQREWGIYNPHDDSYKCSVFPDHPTMYGGSRMVMLDDTTATTKPSAVIYFVGSLSVDADLNISYSDNPNTDNPTKL